MFTFSSINDCLYSLCRIYNKEQRYALGNSWPSSFVCNIVQLQAMMAILSIVWIKRKLCHTLYQPYTLSWLMPKYSLYILLHTRKSDSIKTGTSDLNNNGKSALLLIFCILLYHSKCTTSSKIPQWSKIPIFYLIPKIHTYFILSQI